MHHLHGIIHILFRNEFDLRLGTTQYLIIQGNGNNLRRQVSGGKQKLIVYKLISMSMWTKTIPLLIKKSNLNLRRL